MKNKSAASVANALKEVFTKDSSNRLQTENGKEFLNGDVRHVLTDFRVHNFTREHESIKAALVKRFDQTLAIPYTDILQKQDDNAMFTFFKTSSMPTTIDTTNRSVHLLTKSNHLTPKTFGFISTI